MRRYRAELDAVGDVVASVASLASLIAASAAWALQWSPPDWAVAAVAFYALSTAFASRHDRAARAPETEAR